MAQITSLNIVYSTVYSDADQRKHQISASLAFVWGIHRGPPHKWPVTRKMFPFDDVIISWHEVSIGTVNGVVPVWHQAITRSNDDTVYYSIARSPSHIEIKVLTLQWRQNERDGVSNDQGLDFLFSRLFRRRSKKTSNLRVTGLCEGNPPVTDGFPSQRASYTDFSSIWWRHHVWRRHGLQHHLVSICWPFDSLRPSEA